MAELDGLLREALLTIALLTLPVLALATLVGALVAIVQAATQVQEQTLSLLPKVLAVGAAIAIGAKPALALCAHLFLAALAHVPALVRG
jgi:type III secretory pathway component EscS